MARTWQVMRCRAIAIGRIQNGRAAEAVGGQGALRMQAGRGYWSATCHSRVRSMFTGHASIRWGWTPISG